MKFGKQLEISANPEWRDHYVQYKRLKRLIKRVAFVVEKQQRHASKRQLDMSMQQDQDLNTSPTNLQASDDSAEEISDVRLDVGPMDETRPLLGSKRSPRSQALHDADDVRSAKAEFWSVTEANLKAVNDFYEATIVTLHKWLREFEEQWAENQKASGHVHTRAHSHSISQDHGFSALQDTYDTLVDLRTFVQINFSGFRKIVKKFDKSLHEHATDEFLPRLKNERFFASNEIDELRERLFVLTSKDKLETGNLERRLKRAQGDNHSLFRMIKPVPFGVAVFLFVFFLCVNVVPDGPGQDVQQRCLALLVFVTALWVTEAIPFFATALLVPPLVVFLRILDDKAHPGQLLTAKEAAHDVMSDLVNHTTVLIMGGYSISAAFAKCQIELYIAAFLQRRFKKSPNLFLLAIMLMGLFLSMWISNHTAPVLCISVLLPIIRDFPTDSAYAKTLLIGLAFACNLGGMMTPISSLQSTLAVSYLENAGVSISFGQWMAIAVPFCITATLLCWGFLLYVFNPKDAKYIPQIVYDQKQKVTSYHITVVSLSLLTIVMWATISFTQSTIGDLSIISLMFMVTMFGTGMLTQFDFNSFSWHILFLIGGGNVLGDAVQRSGLLETMSQSVIPYLPQNGVWTLTVSLCLLVLLMTTFISHTVGAIILLPIIVNMSVTMGHPHLPGVCCGLAISSAMALPFSSFPNINSLLVLDDHAQPYLQVKDFLRVGIAFSLITVALIVTMAYGLIILVLGPSATLN